MIEPDVAAGVLRAALSSGGRFAELFAEERSSTQIRLDDGRLEEVVSGVDRGAGVRVFHGESQAYAFTNRLDPASLLEAARVAASAVRAGGDRLAVADLRAGPPIEHEVEIPFATVPMQRRAGWLREADEAARAVDAAVRQVMVAYADSVQRVLVANSDGVWSQEERPRIRLVAQVVAARDDVIQTGFDGPAGLTGAELIGRRPPASVGRKAARMATVMVSAVPAPAGEMPVVLGPGCGGVLFHEACGHGLEADEIQKEASVFRGREGEAIATSLVNGVDEGSVAGAWGSGAIDDEGTPTGRTVLFQEGRLVGCLYDLMRAGHDHEASTGNGRRQSYAHLPIPRMTNSSILPGDDEADQVVADTRRGLYARELGGGQVDPATGDFVFGVAEGYLIEDGRIGGAVRGANLVGNGPAILASIDAVAADFDRRDGVCGKEGQHVPVTCGSPTLRIAAMTVGGTDA